MLYNYKIINYSATVFNKIVNETCNIEKWNDF